MTAYREVASPLGRRIAGGEFGIGMTLPTENALAAECGVARGTVRNALALLNRQGAVTPGQGSGRLVHSSLQTHSRDSIGQFQTRSVSSAARLVGSLSY